MSTGAILISAVHGWIGIWNLTALKCCNIILWNHDDIGNSGDKHNFQNN